MNFEEFKDKIAVLRENFKTEIKGLRTNRPSAALVENIKVHCYHNQVLTIKQLGFISVVPPREINIQLWDQSVAPNAVKAIETSELGLTAKVDGKIIRIHLPELTQERRQELIKRVKQIAENYRIQIRHCRDEVNKFIQASFEKKEIAEDRKFKLKEEVQKEVDKINDEIEEVVAFKINEINS